MTKGYSIKKIDGVVTIMLDKGFDYSSEKGFYEDKSKTTERKFMTFDQLQDEIDLCSCSFVNESKKVGPEEEERLKKVFFEAAQAWRGNKLKK